MLQAFRGASECPYCCLNWTSGQRLVGAPRGRPRPAATGRSPGRPDRFALKLPRGPRPRVVVPSRSRPRSSRADPGPGRPEQIRPPGRVASGGWPSSGSLPAYSPRVNGLNAYHYFYLAVTLRSPIGSPARDIAMSLSRRIKPLLPVATVRQPVGADSIQILCTCPLTRRSQAVILPLTGYFGLQSWPGLDRHTASIYGFSYGNTKQLNPTMVSRAELAVELRALCEVQDTRAS
jgi:hypothetical protein